MYAAKVYEMLKLQVRKDIDARNSLRGGAPHKFELIDHGVHFVAFVEGLGQHRTINFSLTEKGVMAQDNGDVLMDVTITLNDDGECRLRIRGEEKELWQASRITLERLFFE